MSPLARQLQQQDSPVTLSKQLQLQHENSFVAGATVDLSGSYKNPWTSVSRPMNGFIDVREDQWEQNELRKAQLAKDLRQQMDEQREKKE